MATLANLLTKYKKTVVVIAGILAIPAMAFAARTSVDWVNPSGTTYIQPNFGINGMDLLVAGSNHYINFNTVTGTNGYGFRDNAGIMEFKNSGGSWTGIGTGGGGGGGSGGTWATTTSQVAGELINHPNNNSDVVVIGASATTSANYYIDPNINFAFLKYASTTALSNSGVASTSNLTVSSVPNALFLGGSAGAVSAFGGSNCSAGNAPTGINANGSVNGCTAYQASGTYLTVLGNYASTTAAAVSFSTTTVTVNGLTYGLTIVPSASALLFTPTVTGTYNGQAGSVANAATFNNGGSGGASGSTFNGSGALTVSYNTLGAVPTTRLINTTFPLAGGGDLSADRTLTSFFSTTTNTGLPVDQILYTSHTGILVTAASSSIFGYVPLNPTRQLTVAGTANQITSSAAAQDLSADRTWTLSFPTLIVQPNASTTLFSNFKTAYFGGTATTTIDSNGNVTIPSGSNLTITGKSDGCATFASGILNSTGSACGAGGGGGSGGTWATTTSQVSGELINYPLNNTDVVVIGSNSTTTSADFIFDPNTDIATFGTGGAGDSSMVFGPNTSNQWIMGYSAADKSFDISSSTALGTLNALAISKANVLTFAYASSTALTAGNLFSTNASTTNLIVSSAGGTAGCATFSSNGTISNTAVACGTGSGGAAYPFPLTGNATSSPLMILASTTIGSGTQANGLTVSGGATTSLNQYVGGNVGIQIQAPGQALDVLGKLRAASTIADATNKGFFFLDRNFTNAQNDFLIAFGQSKTSGNTLIFGGGQTGFTAASSIAFFTGAGNNTDTGTSRLSIDASGVVAVSAGGIFTSPNASTTLLSNFGVAYFGGTATTTIDSAGNVVIPSGSNLTITGKSDGCATFSSGQLNSTGSACSSGGAAYPFTSNASTVFWNQISVSTSTQVHFGATGISLSASSTSQFDNSSTTLTTLGTLWDLSITSSIALFDGNHKETAYTGSGACSNQFVTVLSAAGVGTCASVTDSTFSGQLGLAHGGTNAASFTTTGSTVYYTGSALATAPTNSAVTTTYASSTAISATTGLVVGSDNKETYSTISFSYGSSTQGSGTTTRSLAPADAPMTLDSIRCDFSAWMLINVTHAGGNRLDYVMASSTVGTFLFTTNNTFVDAEGIRVDISTTTNPGYNIFGGCRIKMHRTN